MGSPVATDYPDMRVWVLEHTLNGVTHSGSEYVPARGSRRSPAAPAICREACDREVGRRLSAEGLSSALSSRLLSSRSVKGSTQQSVRKTAPLKLREKEMAEVRVRVAPSPTGAPHVGTGYIALFNQAFVRSEGGKLVLRIEDTDQNRSRPEHEVALLSSLKWLGLDWDEGPDVGGGHGPYRQSERLDLYQQHARQLVEAEHAYYCFCTPERMQALRAQQSLSGGRSGYDGHCRELPQATVEQQLASPAARIIRMKMRRDGACQFEDRHRGSISFNYENLDDQVLLKSDGFPTYHLAVVVDDHEMKITHVIRGEEWINSMPKHLLLYEQLGWDPPDHVHLPLLLNPDRSKMSKRRNPTSIDYYKAAGYLPQALVNYLALMAYPPPGEGGEGEEKFSLESLAERFDFDRINLGGSVFDIEKLNWLNGRYIREDLTATQLLQALKDWSLNDDYIQQMIPLMQERMDTLGDFMPKCGFFFAREVNLSVEELTATGKHEPKELVEMLQTVMWALDAVDDKGPAGVESALARVAAFWEWPIRDVTKPLFVTVMGQSAGPPLYESMAILGMDLARTRLRSAMNVLGGLSKKKERSLENRWTEVPG
jgi:glutamyl-tRNA synthetase